MASTLESAIAPHLRVERTLPAKTPPGYQPLAPAYSARFPEKTKTIVMAILGAQAPAGRLSNDDLGPLLSIITSENSSAPLYWDMSLVTDTSGFDNKAAICYWSSVPEYVSWCASSGFDSWWKKLDRSASDVGWFKEVFLPPIERFETIFSHNEVPEGAANMREGVSGQVLEHVYWGSMRDRMPVTQTDAVDGEGWTPPADSRGSSAQQASGRVKVRGRNNLCVIRSGQDWSATTPTERKLYLETMHPVLERGMNFLRDEGAGIGCFSCRFMELLEPSQSSKGTDKTFGLAFFDSMASLEKWSREHKTHLDIFGRYLAYAKELGAEMSLRLYHEVLVLKPEQQEFEYVHCHPKTGMLVSAGVS